MYSPDIDRALGETALVIENYDVAGQSAWYWAK